MKTTWLVVVWVLLLLVVVLTGGCLVGITARHQIFLGAGYFVVQETNEVTQVKVFGLFGGNLLSKFNLAGETNKLPKAKP